MSALIHAATMVTTGVFFIIRSGPLFEGSSLVLTILTFLGALTAFFAATAGVAQNDLKKVNCLFHLQPIGLYGDGLWGI